MNTTIRSKYLKEFIEEIKFRNRNPRKLKAIELLDDIETNPEILLDVGFVVQENILMQRR